VRLDHGVDGVARIADEEGAGPTAAGEDLYCFEGAGRVRQVDAFARIFGRWWTREDSRVFMPNAFGWGYDINLAALLTRLGALRRR
jgi:hypothetical protein